MTHPFHPWCGREFVFIAVRHTWGEDRVYFFGDEGTQKSLPRAWTDAADVDVFVSLSGSRIWLLWLRSSTASGRLRLRHCMRDFAVSAAEDDRVN